MTKLSLQARKSALSPFIRYRYDAQRVVMYDESFVVFTLFLTVHCGRLWAQLFHQERKYVVRRYECCKYSLHLDQNLVYRLRLSTLRQKTVLYSRPGHANI